MFSADLAKAIMLSKADAPQHLNDDGIVLLRLDRHARATEVAEALLHSPALESCRSLVAEAQCEMQPAWAGGAWILFPMTRQLFEEAALKTSSIHVLVLSKDEPALRQALKSVPKPKRPLLQKVDVAEASVVENHFPVSVSATSGGACDGVADSMETQTGAASREETDGDYEVVVECIRTFLTLRCISGDGKVSSVSAPARLEQDDF